uniref:Uncharacterized protein n=1 Tax=Arion vulgaris TaxID=1028688 RepID=A0A0B6Y928_9EUPU
MKIWHCEVTSAHTLQYEKTCVTSWFRHRTQLTWLKFDTLFAEPKMENSNKEEKS